LLDFLKAESVALAKVLAREGLEATERTVARYSEINDYHWKLLEMGRLTRDEVKFKRFQVFFDEMRVKTDVEAARRFYEEQLGIGHYFMPGAVELLEALHGKYRLFIMSNGTTSVQNRRIASANIAHYFEKIFLSEAVGYNKPKKEFFDVCFAQIEGFDPEKAIILGDSLSSDILGGINAGIATCWFNPIKKAGSPAIIPDYEIETLAEFVPLLQSIN
jgi:2-haloacid dehalogenase